MVKIKKITKIEYKLPIDVFDIEVHNEKNIHNFMVEGNFFIHNCCIGGCHSSVTCTGSSTVFVNSLPAARVGDVVCCSSSILTGSFNVFERRIDEGNSKFFRYRIRVYTTPINW